MIRTTTTTAVDVPQPPAPFGSRRLQPPPRSVCTAHLPPKVTAVDTLLNSHKKNSSNKSKRSTPSDLDSLSSSSSSSLTAVIPYLPAEDHADRLERLIKLTRVAKHNQLWREVRIIDRLIYKNTNQHRSAVHHHKLVRVRQITRRIEELDIAQVLVEYGVGLFFQHGGLPPLQQAQSKQQKTGGKQQQLPQKAQLQSQQSEVLKQFRSIDRLPSREALIHTCIKLGDCILLLDALQSALVDAFGAFYALLRQGFFMPLAVVVLAAASRLTALVKMAQKELREIYNLIHMWLPYFPSTSASNAAKASMDLSVWMQRFEQLPASASGIRLFKPQSVQPPRESSQPAQKKMRLEQLPSSKSASVRASPALTPTPAPTPTLLSTAANPGYDADDDDLGELL
ncbi:hypothetical protein GQ42DRAFT_164185 [Ramicandelaber brevisporus]|nr:hypothetical protein GQ42DRAFT_164185 [Ramicandelaber brevisporus]